MSAFDVSNFLNAGTSEAGDTVIQPIPADTYTAIIDKVEAREVTSDKGKSVVLDVTFLLQA